MIADCSVFSLLQVESCECLSLLCSSSTHWSGRLGRRWAWLGKALGRAVKGRASCHSGREMDTDHIHRILPEPDVALLHQL